MKLRVSVAVPRGGEHDVTLSCDVTATVADIARALISCGLAADTRTREISESRLAPVTLRAAPDSGARAYLLDPTTPLAASGLQSGWIIAPVLEFAECETPQRLIEVAAFARVLNGPQRDVQFSLVPGTSLIGRDPTGRVHLLDQSVSRRHAEVVIADQEIVVRDLGSANGITVNGRRVSEIRIDRPTTLVFGDIELLLVPGPPSAGETLYSHRVMHTRAPRVAPHFPASSRELPAPPSQPRAGRIPMLAMLAPMMMGGAMYAITQSPMSLMMIVFSPMMMIGSWLDGALGGKRKLTKDLIAFRHDLDEERAELERLSAREIEVRATETPTLAETTRAVAHRDELLWTRRPEHRSFLEVRFGEGILPSRTELTLPPRGESPREQWELLQRMRNEFAQVDPVPVIERFERCGSIGVAGDEFWAESAAASLVMQLVALHSPYETVLACFAGPQHNVSWGWLKWLPHVDPIASPLPSWQLADSPSSSMQLLTALEGLLETRRAAGRSAARLRSHLHTDTRNDDAQGDAVTELPMLPSVVVLVLDDGLVDQARLIDLAEKGPDCGVHLIWVAQTRAALPAACRTFVELDHGRASVHFVRSNTIVPLTRVETLDHTNAHGLARRIAPVEDTAARVLDESDLPRAVDLRALHRADLLGGAGAIAAVWDAGGSLTASWNPGQERAPIALDAVVGQSPAGPVSLDLRTHGPHALVGGTTGAGKSEFLQTWIMSMAVNVSPDRLTFLLVDYKGGAAFAECVDLPHTVGLVTDLSPHLVRRALTSLRAELHYREELLAAHGSKDLITMERRSDPAAPPALIIVIDEFAALAGEVPEFVDGIIDIAQRGRSLGLHLVMATQRPAGVIKDNLRANTNLRIALRMADESDSTDVIGVSDAAFFDAETPGRGTIKVGPGRITHFQTGYLGGRATNEGRAVDIELRSLGFVEGEPWNIPPEPAAAQKTTQRAGQNPRQEARDIERLRDGIIAANAQAGLSHPRRPWLDELPALLTAAELQDRSDETAEPSSHGIVLGLRDDPAAQSQHPVAIDFEEIGGLAFIGAGGTGKTTALITLAASLSAEAAREPVQIYAIDAASGVLDTISALPTVGAVAPLADSELTGRVLRRVHDTMQSRGPRFAAARANGLQAYRRSANNTHERNSPNEPRVFLFIDGFAAFRQATDSGFGADRPLDLLAEILMNGRAVGVHVVLTSDRPAAIPASMLSVLQQQYVLRLVNPNDYSAVGVSPDILEGAPPGRAVLAGDGREVQLVVLGTAPDGAITDNAAGLAAQSAAIDALAAELWAGRIAAAPEVVNAPAEILFADLLPGNTEAPAYGIDTRTFDPVTLPLRGLGVIAGPSGAGLSTAALTCVNAVERFAAERHERVDTVLLSFADDGLAARRDWGRIASTVDEIGSMAGGLVVALGGKTEASSGPSSAGLLSGELFGADSAVVSSQPASPPAAEQAREPFAFPAQGARGVIVVERPAEAEGTGALRKLVALAKAARRADVLVLFEFESGTAGSIWELYQVLKQPKWGLALQPDQHEAQSPFREDLGRVQRADFPPGRGFAIESGRVVPVHIALSQGIGVN